MDFHDKLKHVSALAVRETLEEMAFIELTEEIGSLNKELISPMRQVSLEISKPIIMAFGLAFSNELLKEITASIYGLEETEISEVMENDVLAELLNTISGRIMKSIVPQEQAYDLGIPCSNKTNNCRQKVNLKSLNFYTEDNKYCIFSINHIIA